MGEIEPGGETNLSEVMLIFQVGGERTSVPRWDGSSSLLLCMNHCGVERAVYDSPNKSQMWCGFSTGRGKLGNSLHEGLCFYELLFL